MAEYLCVRATEVLGQEELVGFLKSRFPKATKQIGRAFVSGTECVEVRVPCDSSEFEEIREFIVTRRRQQVRAFSAFNLGRYLRKYTKKQLLDSEILRLNPISHFEPSGEECGTVYETLCKNCNWGRQISDLVLDLRRVPQHKDMSETIAWVEWIVSSKFAQTFAENEFRGAEFHPIFDLRNPIKRSDNWNQLRITGAAGSISGATKMGRDPFSPSELNWQCPLGHSVVTQFLSEIHLERDEWDGSDIAITGALFGQGHNLLRPTPLIFISQRMYRAINAAGLTGFSLEVAHLT
jgi:hypothetical protein